MKPILTKEDYINNHEYMSFTRFSRFLKCEAAAAANFREPPTPSMLVGSYVDAYFSGELDDFRKEHPEIFNSRTGELKADFKKAEDIIKRYENDVLLREYSEGDKQKIMTGFINNVPFKIKMDVYKNDERIVDWKIMKDFEDVWSDDYRSYVNFMTAYNYDIELAIFQEIVFQNTNKRLPCYISSVTKQEPSDLNIFHLPQDTLNEALGIVKRRLPRIKGILDGIIAPERCEKCAYCRLTKKAKVLNFDLAGLNGDQLREEGIECNDPKITKK